MLNREKMGKTLANAPLLVKIDGLVGRRDDGLFGKLERRVVSTGAPGLLVMSIRGLVIFGWPFSVDHQSQRQLTTCNETFTLAAVSRPFYRPVKVLIENPFIRPTRVSAFFVMNAAIMYSAVQ